MSGRRPPTGAALAAALVVTAAAGCGDDDPPPPSCNENVPTFLLEVTASPAVPTSTRVEVRFGGGTEVYAVDAEPAPSAVLFCNQDATGAAGAAASAPVRCELWTRAAATVEVVAPGFVTVEETLRPDEIDDCLVTRQVSIELQVEPPPSPGE